MAFSTASTGTTWCVRSGARASPGNLEHGFSNDIDVPHYLAIALQYVCFFAIKGSSIAGWLTWRPVVAIFLMNSPIGPAFEAIWRQELGMS